VSTEPAELMRKQIAAHEAAHAEEIERLRAMSMEERGRLIELACEAAAEIRRGRLASGLPDVTPEPWPASTWEFLRKHAARVREQANT
jgi:hypothetical protein